MITESITDATLMGAVDVSLDDLNRSIELLRERGYDVTIKRNHFDNKVGATINRPQGQLQLTDDIAFSGFVKNPPL